MANVATMGPPPSPKEPRRSGRRSVPSHSASKSPAGSPTSETAPKSKDATQRPPLTSTSSSNRNRRTKNEEIDAILEEPQRTITNGASNGRTKRKEPTNSHGDPQDDDEEEAGVTRCICQETGIDESEAGEFMAECEACHAWQHGTCMGYQSPETMPTHYFCERCRPALYPELLKKHAKRARQSSAASHHTAANPPRTSRSHSPTYLLKQPAKRRNTMNSRDAAYDESLQAIIEASAAEAAANAVPQDGSSPAVVQPDLVVNGHTENDPEAEVVVPGRKKRKRTEDDTNSSKRTRSASIVSDLPHGNNAAPEASPIATTKPSLPLPTTTATTATKPAQPRARRGGGRKAQVQELAEGEEVASTSSGRRQTSGRSKANAAHEHGARRSYANGVNGHGPSSHAATAAASRAYHNSHAYAVSQQPLFTSWNLPDYLAHLEQLLPTETPRPLELRGFGTATNGQDSADRTTERGVKVKWPSKRMSVVDMNKRVRALVEWVGREQANATERTRRREAVEKSLGERDTATADRSGALDSVEGRTNSLLLEGGTLTQSPAEEHQLPSLSARFITSLSLEGPGPDPGKETMKLMEELMEELISFQERFGPGAKIKERERRTATS